MCRNIKPLFNFSPPATQEELHDAALQYVRKVSGFREPSHANQAAFDQAVQQVAQATKSLVNSLSTTSKPRNRQEEARRAHERAVKRFGR